MVSCPTSLHQPASPIPLPNLPIMHQRRTKSTRPSSDTNTKAHEKSASSHTHLHNHADDHDHAHSHSIFHTHSHDGHAHAHDAEGILKALQGGGTSQTSPREQNRLRNPRRPWKSDNAHWAVCQRCFDRCQRRCCLVHELCISARRCWSFLEWCVTLFALTHAAL